MYCPNCGSQNSDKSVACSHCGLDLSKITSALESPILGVGNRKDQDSAPKSSREDSGRKKLFAVFFGVTVIVCIIGLIVWMIWLSNPSGINLRSSPKLQWSANYQRGESLPIISGDKVFLLVPGSNGGFPAAVNLSSGKRIWTSEYDATSMVLIGDDLLILRSDSRVYSLNSLNGEVNWKYFSDDRIDQIVSGDGIIALHTVGRVIIALGLTNGQLLWRTALPNGYYDLYNDKLKNIHDGYVWGDGYDYAIKADTGEVWYPTREFCPEQSCRIFISNTYLAEVSGKNVIAFDAITHQEKWRTTACWVLGSLIETYRDTVFIETGSDSNKCDSIDKGYVLDLYSGKERWSWNVSTLGNVVGGNSNTIYLSDRYGIIHALDPNR